VSVREPRVSVGAIRIDARARRAMTAHARRDAPRECCGLLIGRGAEVHFAAAVANHATSASRYRLDDRAHIALRRALRSFTPPLEIVGVYHSHPTGRAWPSETDIAEAHYPEWCHVIVALGRRVRLAAFRIRRGRVEQLSVVGFRHGTRPGAGV